MWLPNIRCSSFGKYWFPELCRSSKCWYISSYNIKKKNLACVTDLIRKKTFILRTCQAHSGRYKFFKILIFTWKLRFYHWHHILSVVFFEVTDTLCSFLRKCLPNIQVWKTSLLVIFFKEKKVFMFQAKMASSVHSSNKLPCAAAWEFGLQHKSFMCVSHFITENV